MPQIVTEATTVLEATAVEGKPGKLRIGVISPGKGSSGFYPKEVLEAAADDKVFPKGTHCYFDHPTATEKFDRPERSVLTLGAVFEDDAYWDEALGKLVAEVNIVGPYKELLTDKTFREAIGMSIVASAEVEETAEGRVVKRLVEGKSVDFVTHAGRGGSILDVLESALPSNVNGRAVAHGVAEATVNDRREALSTLVRDAYAADRTYVWLRDFDDTTAWFDVETSDSNGTWQQAYTSGDDGLPTALSGERVEVRATTQYVPAVPAGLKENQVSKEDNMATTQIEESALTELREKAGRVAVLENERDTEKARADMAEAKLAEAEAAATRNAAADTVIKTVAQEAGVVFDDLQVAGLKAQLPVKEGALDIDAFTTTVTTHAKSIAEARARAAVAGGAGNVFGFGLTSVPNDTDGISEAELHEALGITVKEA